MLNRTRRTLLGSASTAILALLAGAASAQSTSAASAAADVETIVVTGSRLQGGFAAPTPVTAVSAKAIEEKAPSQIIDIIYDLPSVRMDSGPGQNLRFAITQTIGYVSNVNLRGLGSGRTLVLVNGYRQVRSSLGGTFDSTRIPVGMVDRVDVVTGGASAAYGSDAVAGVVNFILKDTLDGVQGSVQYGMTGHGDNKQLTANFAAGGGFLDDRARYNVGVDYTDGKGVDPIYARSWGALEPGLLTHPTTRPADVPAQVWTNGVELSNAYRGSLIVSGPLKGTAFDDNGNPFPFQYGTVVNNVMTGTTSHYGYNPLGHFNLANPVSRLTTMGRGSFDVTDTVTAFADIAYTTIRSGGQTGLTTIPSINISIANPFIPAATRAQMVANNLTTITVGWLGDALNPRKTGPAYIAENHNYVTQMNAGLRGSVFEDWNWDLNFSYGIAKNDLDNLSKPHVPNFLAAVNAVVGPNGQPACGNIDTAPNLSADQRALVMPGCVPYNLFGMNAASEAARAYVGRVTRLEQEARQTSIAVNLAGQPFSTWAGAVELAVGGEHRSDKIAQVGEGIDSSAFNFGGTTTFSGQEKVTEGYVEVGVPLLREAPMASALDFNGAVRRTDYSISGGVTTWKAGLTYDVNDVLRFRGTKSRDIRAPNLVELYNVGAKGTTNNVRNPFNNVVGQLYSIGSGNTNLKPETADTWTGGAVVQVSSGALAGFRASLDYYKISIDGIVAAVGALNTVTRCFSGLQEYCAAITFDNTPFGIAVVRTQQFNLNKLETDGFDAEIAYRVPLDALPGELPGALDLRFLGGYVRTLATTELSGVRTNRSGTTQGLPRLSVNMTASYSLERFSTQLRARYFTKMKADPNLVGPDDPTYSPTLANSVSKNVWPSLVYWSLGAQYNVHKTDRTSVQLFANIDNLFDKDPPQFAPIAFSQGTQIYDLLGRMIRVGVRLTM
jgi:outer membrane receptor protein involved in Fe transport